jgi:septal ring factor EnvC (AmiA/AmiB activator)
MEAKEVIAIIDSAVNGINTILSTVTTSQEKQLTRTLQACQDSPDNANLQLLLSAQERVSLTALETIENLVGKQMAQAIADIKEIHNG